MSEYELPKMIETFKGNLCSVCNMRFILAHLLTPPGGGVLLRKRFSPRKASCVLNVFSASNKLHVKSSNKN